MLKYVKYRSLYCIIIQVIAIELNFKITSSHFQATYPFFITLYTTNYSCNRPIFRMVVNEKLVRSIVLKKRNEIGGILVL